MEEQRGNRVQAIQELRRSNAATSIPSGKLYSRTSKYDDYDDDECCGLFVPCEQHTDV